MAAAVWLLGLALTVQVPPPRAAESESASIRNARQAIELRETTDLIALAGRIAAAGHPAEAERVLNHVKPSPPSPDSVCFTPLEEVVATQAKTQPKGPANAADPKPTAADAEAETEAGKIRADAARALYDLAIKAMSGNTPYYALADECLRAVLDRDPDHAQARRLLGYVPHDGGWATPFAVEQIKKGKVRHPTYGWVDESWVPHLQKGELPAPFAAGQTPRWMGAAKANKLRNSIERGWRIETEHFLVQTDVPLSEAIGFGRKLEVFHGLFFSLLADVIADDLPLAARHRDKADTLLRPPPHTVYYFASKKDYSEYLRPRGGPGISKSLGIYFPPQPGQSRSKAFFYRDLGGQLDTTSTLYHEVSHQLLFESTSVGPSRFEMNEGNYWVFEGLGTYFETIRTEPDGTLRVGGFVGPRIQVARVLLLDRNDYVPLELFVGLRKKEFDNPAQVHANYAQAMALTVFLMHGHDGEYRDGFLDYVTDALHGRLRNDGSHQLNSRLGVSYKELEAEFIAALKLSDRSGDRARRPGSEKESASP